MSDRDVMVSLLGLTLIVAGTAFVYWPAALIVTGGALLTLGLFAELR